MTFQYGTDRYQEKPVWQVMTAVMTAGFVGNFGIPDVQSSCKPPN